MINLSKLAALAKATPKELAQSTSADALAQEKLTRRAALRRIGMTGAMTVLGVLSVDELARVAARKLDEHEMTRGLAKDFKYAGVAMAEGASSMHCEGTDCKKVCRCAYNYYADACGSEPQYTPSPLLTPAAAYILYKADHLKWSICLNQAAAAEGDCINQLCP